VARMSHHTDKCNSSDGIQVFENEDKSLTGFCFACRTFVPDPMGEGKGVSDLKPTKMVRKSKEELEQEISFVSRKLPTLPLKDRLLSATVLEQYNIKIGVSEVDGTTPTYAYFPYTKGGILTGYKVKHLPTGNVWWISTDRDVDLFGWEQAKASGAKRLIITEGEFDAPALRRIMEVHTKAAYKDYIPAICSIPNGSGSAARDIQRLLPEIKKFFKDISICFDEDEAGKLAVEEVCKILPDAKVIHLPAKDANDCLVQGKGLAAQKAVSFHSEKPKNSRIIWGREVHDAAKQQAEWGLSWPWPKLTDLTRGIRFGETIYIAAGEKMGKSEVVNALGAHLIKAHGLKILLAKPEEANVKTYKLLVSKVTGKIYHDPKVKFDEPSYDTGGLEVQDNMCMINLYQHIGWETLKADIYSASSQGVKAVFIDPITNLTNGMSSSQINEHLQMVSQDLAAVAKDLDIVIFIFCHLNKPAKGNTPWDRGGIITTDYLAGSSGMARSCNYVFGLQGNKDPALETHVRNTRELVLLADREFGEAGSAKLYWDSTTGLFNEIKE
jgi:twinkle protein